LFSAGGGVLNRGNLTLSDVIVENNLAGGGGGIHSSGELVLEGSTVRGNRSTGITANGGGISNFGTMTIRQSTISGNTVFGTSASTLGGGIINVGTLTMQDSTVSGNEASGNFGGGIFHANSGVLTVLTNVTITDNTIAGHGGGLARHGIGKVRLTNTLVAHNHAGDTGADCSATIDSQGHNLIRDTEECVITGVTTGNILGRQARLQALADNGGPTETHALRRNSLAVDAGDDAACGSRDQRGVDRSLDGDRDGTATCDIGAYELER
jgi:predicted outer membrane repeat protein